MKSAYNNSGNIMSYGFGCICNNIEINLFEDFTGKMFCSPFTNYFKISVKLKILRGVGTNFELGVPELIHLSQKMQNLGSYSMLFWKVGVPRHPRNPRFLRPCIFHFSTITERWTCICKYFLEIKCIFFKFVTMILVHSYIYINNSGA